MNTKRTITLLAALIAAALLPIACGDKEETSPASYGVQDTAPVETDTIPSGWVDLGLPSGLLWAECNIGATVPEEYGGYYAWAETEPKREYSWFTYRYCNGGENKLTKYCNWNFNGYNGFTDSLLTLQPEDDVATTFFCNKARIPSVNEWKELKNNTTSKWTSENGILGVKFYGNGDSIFLPTAGERRYTEEYNQGVQGRYWSATVCVDGPKLVWFFGIDTAYPIPNIGQEMRYKGLPIRAVRQR